MRSIALVMSSLLFAVLSPARSDDGQFHRDRYGRPVVTTNVVEVGDLTIELSPKLDFNRSALPGGSESDTRLAGVSITSMDAQKLIDPDRTGAPYTYHDALLDLYVYQGETIDFWCTNNHAMLFAGRTYTPQNAIDTKDSMYVYPEKGGGHSGDVRIPTGSVRVLNSPVILFDAHPKPVEFESLSTVIAITHRVALHLRFSPTSMGAMTVPEFLIEIDKSVRSLLRRTPDLNDKLYHRDNRVCPN